MCSYSVNRDIVIVNENDINDKYIFNLFFYKKTEIIYVRNQKNKKNNYRMISLGTFLKHSFSDNKTSYVRDICSYVLYSNNEKKEVEEALNIINKKGIKSAVPVIDNQGEILYEIVVKKEIPNYCEKEKILIEKSNSLFLKEEYAILKNILIDKDTILLGKSGCLPEFIDIFLNEEEKDKIVENIKDYYSVLVEGKKLVIDIDPENSFAHCVIDSRYPYMFSYAEFVYEALYSVESEIFGHIRKISFDNPKDIQKFYEKYRITSNTYNIKKLYKNELYRCLVKSGVKCRIENCLERSFYVNVQENGQLRSVLSETMWFQAYDRMRLFLQLSFYCKDNNIECLNFVTDGDVLLNDIEKINFEHHRYFKDLLLEDNQLISSMYKGINSKKERKINEIANYGVVLQRRLENDLLLTKDISGEFFNIKNGIRVTTGSPKQYVNTIYIFGACTIFGSVVSDDYTIPSLIQKKINKTDYNYRVINFGVSGSPDILKMLKSVDIKSNDIVVILYPHIIENYCNSLKMINILPAINETKKKSEEMIFFDSVSHIGEKGSELFADEIYKHLSYKLVKSTKENMNNNIYNMFKNREEDICRLYNYDSYRKMLLEEGKKVPIGAKRIGAIVMNANPFTKGHLFLTEYAISKCDYLFIFVVEENKSFFSTNDRIEMVKRGVSKLKNVSVVMSGKLIVSSHTFPEYFNKENTDEGKQMINVNEDIRLFSQYLAPLVGINIRFLGEEPVDQVTKQYNKALKNILPLFNIDVEEIPRKKARNNIISASSVRKLFQKEDFVKMQELCPESTIEYLKMVRNKRYKIEL